MSRTQQKEMWRDIYGYNGMYQVSNRGRVRNAKYMRILSHDVSKTGYHRVKLVDYDANGNRTIKQHMVHRLVALCFVPIYSLDRNQINHIDGNKWNNDWENLEWCNNSENQLHRHKLGRENRKYGEENHKAVLSDNQAREIKAKYNTGNYTQAYLAKLYGVSQSAISQIVSNKIRKIN